MHLVNSNYFTKRFKGFFHRLKLMSRECSFISNFTYISDQHFGLLQQQSMLFCFQNHFSSYNSWQVGLVQIILNAILFFAVTPMHSKKLNQYFYMFYDLKLFALNLVMSNQQSLPNKHFLPVDSYLNPQPNSCSTKIKTF